MQGIPVIMCLLLALPPALHNTTHTLEIHNAMTVGTLTVDMGRRVHVSGMCLKKRLPSIHVRHLVVDNTYMYVYIHAEQNAVS